MEQTAIEYKCPNCGAHLTFDAQTQLLSCDYCDSCFTHEQIVRLAPRNEEIKLEEIAEDDEFFGNTYSYQCPNCGAEVITESNVASTFCYYCHSPVVLMGRLAGKYKPSKLIPFKKVKEDAEQEFLKWAKRFYVPRDFTSKSTLERLQGIYLPYWIGNFDVQGLIIADCNISKSRRVGDTRITDTKLYSCVREGSMSFKGIPQDGSTKADDMLMENIEPYYYKELVPFSMAYLSGHLAEKYDVPPEAAQQRLNERAIKGAADGLLDTIAGYTEKSIKTQEIHITNSSIDYMMLPVWFLSYKYHGKFYHFAMNGQTGKLAGELPVSRLKAAITSIITALVLAGLIFLWGMFGE